MRLLFVILILTICVNAFEGNCAFGWLRFEEKCYRIFTKNDNILTRNFTDAVSYCQQDFLSGELGSVLITPKRNDSEINEEWVDGTVVDFRNWDQGELNHSNDSCAEMGTSGRWNYVPCDSAEEFFCQSNLSQSYYSVSAVNASWSEAEEACQEDGSHLASIQDGFEMAILRRLLTEKASDYWIGLRATLSQLERFEDKRRHYLRWSDHRPVYHLEWEDSEPKYSSNNETQCVYLKNNFRWAVADCQEQKPFICVKHAQRYEKKERVEGYCRNSAEEWNRNIIEVGGDNCYLIGSDIAGRTDFDDARSKCQQLGGDLAVFETSEEMKLLRPHLREDSGNTSFWVGGIGSINSSQVHIENLTGNSIPEDPWSDGQPNQLDEELRAAFNSRMARLFSSPRNSSHSFICEISKVAKARQICDSDKFRCDNNKCVPLYNRCDDYNDCGDNSDEKDCAQWQCVGERWKCDNGKCILKAWRCDGVKQCRDKSDEKDCELYQCPYYLWKCNNGVCIYDYYRCDGANNCGDNSDEKGCALFQCPSNKWKCDNGKCIVKQWRCDRGNDCGDSSDEKDCALFECPPNKWKCRDGTCVAKSSRCDGVNDCGDNSDENDCALWQCSPFLSKCNNGKCIMTYQFCDGFNNCGDNSDEKDCALWSCSTNRWKCDNGICISDYDRCDGSDDCGDNSDEKDCAN